VLALLADWSVYVLICPAVGWVHPAAVRPQDRRPGRGDGVEQRRRPFAGVISGALIYGEALSRGGGRPPRPSRDQETVSRPRRRAITSRS
jgi:hypothetical protein